MNEDRSVTGENNKVGAIIVAGASAGGLQALSQLAAQIPGNLDAAVFVVMHLSRKAIGSVLVQHLQGQTKFHCKVPVNGEPILKGYLYIAPPDHHMLVKEDKIVVVKGPLENRWRPSIDSLFRSAATSWGNKVIGIVLTGLLDDGTSGMYAVQQAGGICIVQDPNEAEFPDMVLSVLNNMEVDHCVHLADIGYIIQDITSKPKSETVDMPARFKKEAEIAERVAVGIDKVKDMGEHTPFVCPDCGGPLWELTEGNLHRYRCYTGHAYTQQALMDKQREAFEETMWVAIRMMEERRNMLLVVAQGEQKKGLLNASLRNEERANEMKVHIDRLKDILFSMSE